MRGVRIAGACAALALGVVATACAPTGTLSHKLAGWESGSTYGSTQSLLSTDLSEISTGIRRGPVVALHTACDGLGVDSATAYGYLPTPDQEMTDDLNTEYLDLSKAAQICSEAPGLHAKAIASYEELVKQAVAARTAATRRAKAIG